MWRSRALARLLGLDPHADLHRGPPGGVDRRGERHELADVDRLQERHPVHARGDHAAARVPDGREARDLVAELHHRAAVHVAGGVGVDEAHPADEHRARVGGFTRAWHGMGTLAAQRRILREGRPSWPAWADACPPSSRRRSTSSSTRPRIPRRPSSTATRSRWSCCRTSRRASRTSSRPRSASSCSSRSSSSRSSSSTRRRARRSRRTARTSPAPRSSASSSRRPSCSRSTSRSPSSRPSRPS